MLPPGRFRFVCYSTMSVGRTVLTGPNRPGRTRTGHVEKLASRIYTYTCVYTILIGRTRRVTNANNKTTAKPETLLTEGSVHYRPSRSQLCVKTIIILSLQSYCACVCRTRRRDRALTVVCRCPKTRANNTRARGRGRTSCRRRLG